MMGLGLVALLAALPACDSASAAEARDVTATAQGRGAAEAAPGQNPLETVEQAKPADTRFSGRVEEVLRAGSYTYLLIVCDDDSAQRWVVTLGRGADVGDQVAIHNMGTKQDFRSKRLERTFAELVFGIVRLAQEGAK
jgi:hypothetical protein